MLDEVRKATYGRAKTGIYTPRPGHVNTLDVS